MPSRARDLESRGRPTIPVPYARQIAFQQPLSKEVHAAAHSNDRDVTGFCLFEPTLRDSSCTLPLASRDRKRTKLEGAMRMPAGVGCWPRVRQIIPNPCQPRIRRRVLLAAVGGGQFFPTFSGPRQSSNGCGSVFRRFRQNLPIWNSELRVPALGATLLIGLAAHGNFSTPRCGTRTPEFAMSDVRDLFCKARVPDVQCPTS